MIGQSPQAGARKPRNFRVDCSSSAAAKASPHTADSWGTGHVEAAQPSRELRRPCQTSDVVDDLSKERRQELAEVLHDLEGYSPRAAEAERRTEELVEKLDNRNAALDKARARITELEEELVQAAADAGDREQRVVAELEVERVRIAEREQTFRDEIAAREREVERRIELLEGREAELRYSDGLLLQREHALGVREAELDNLAQELEARSDERLKAREAELDAARSARSRSTSGTRPRRSAGSRAGRST